MEMITFQQKTNSTFSTNTLPRARVVIELKAGEADRDTIGQIIPYISWVKTNMANGQEVRGIIVANSFDYRVIQSLDVLPFLGLIRYKVDFKFEEAN